MSLGNEWPTFCRWLSPWICISSLRRRISGRRCFCFSAIAVRRASSSLLAISAFSLLLGLQHGTILDLNEKCNGLMLTKDRQVPHAHQAAVFTGRHATTWRTMAALRMTSVPPWAGVDGHGRPLLTADGLDQECHEAASIFLCIQVPQEMLLKEQAQSSLIACLPLRSYQVEFLIQCCQRGRTTITSCEVGLH